MRERERKRGNIYFQTWENSRNMIWKDETHTKATFTFQINLMPTFLPYVFRLKRL